MPVDFNNPSSREVFEEYNKPATNLVETTDANGNQVVKTSEEEATKIDEVSSSLTYVGYAVLGADPSQPVWKIKKITTSGTVTSIQYPDGKKTFSFIWDDRTTLTYL